HRATSNCGKPRITATSFISETTEPSLVGSAAACTPRHSAPNGVARSAAVGASELHVAGGCGIASPGYDAYSDCSAPKPLTIAASHVGPSFVASPLVLERSHGTKRP